MMLRSRLQGALRVGVVALVLCACATFAGAQTEPDTPPASAEPYSAAAGVSVGFAGGPSAASTMVGRGFSLGFVTGAGAASSVGRGVSVGFSGGLSTIGQTFVGRGVSVGFGGGASNGNQFFVGRGVVVEFGVPDTFAPTSSITLGPPEGASVAQADLQFDWAGTDDRTGQLTYSTRVDGGAWSPFGLATSRVVPALSRGTHSFDVRAMDTAGNVGPPASRSFSLVAGNYLPGSTLPSGFQMPLVFQIPAGISVYQVWLYTSGGTTSLAFTNGTALDGPFEFVSAGQALEFFSSVELHGFGDGVYSSYLVEPRYFDSSCYPVLAAGASAAALNSACGTYLARTDYRRVGGVWSSDVNDQFVFQVAGPTSVVLQGTPLQLTAAVQTERYSSVNWFGAVVAQASLMRQNAVVVGPTVLHESAGQFAGAVDTTALASGHYDLTYVFSTLTGTALGTQTLPVDIVAGLALTLATDRPEYSRGQTVAIAGTLLDASATPMPSVPVDLAITLRGSTRHLTVYTSVQGDFSFPFVLPPAEAGSFTVTATAASGTASRQASTSFVVHGLAFEPVQTAVSMSMNSRQVVPLRVRNLGDSTLSGLTLTTEDPDAADAVTLNLDLVALGPLAPGASQDVLATITAGSAAPPAVPLTFHVQATGSAPIVVDTAAIAVTLRAAAGIAVVEPPSSRVGLAPGDDRLVTFTLRNEGTAVLTGVQAAVSNAAAFPWVTLQNAALGDLAPGETRDFGARLQPQTGIALGEHQLVLTIAGAQAVLSVPLTVEVAPPGARDTQVRVADDAGADVAGAQVTLVSAMMFTRTGPSGIEQYNQIYQGQTDGTGALTLSGVLPGEYALHVRAGRHADYDTTIVVDPGAAPLQVEAVLSTTVVTFDFKVTPTTVSDDYDVSLVVTYSTDLVKPALIASPVPLDLAFYPQETVRGTVTVTNSHTQASVTNVLVDASGLDASMREVFLSFDATGGPTIDLGTLAPGEVRAVPFTATIKDGAAPLPHALGSITVSGQFIYSLHGQARTGTTESSIPTTYRRPRALELTPPVEFLSDQRSGTFVPLQYTSPSTRLTLLSRRNVPLSLYDLGGQPTASAPLSALQMQLPSGIPDDQVPFLAMPQAALTQLPLDTSLLPGAGAQAHADVSPLISQLVSQTNLASVPTHLGVVGRWEDGTATQGFVFPVALTVLTPTTRVITQPIGTTSQGCLFCGPAGLPQPFNDHGLITLQIDQKVSVEREAFNASVDILPATSLDGFAGTLAIVDANGNDASALFVVTQTATPALPITSRATANWLIIPKVDAAGTLPAGASYTVSARLDYSAGGAAYTFATAPEVFTVEPLPRLDIEYTIPYVVMGTIPFEVGVTVTNVGAGAARRVTLTSAQPQIVENTNHLPISFGIDGSSSTGAQADYQQAQPTVTIPSLAPGASQSAFWRMMATRRGFITNFVSSLRQRTINGAVLDPIVTARVRLVPAVGGRLLLNGCNTGPLIVRLTGVQTLDGVVSAAGDYYVSGFDTSLLGTPFSTFAASVLESGRFVSPAQNVDVLTQQPTDFVDLTTSADVDGDGMPDCWEETYGLDRFDPSDAKTDVDLDGQDGLLNLAEYLAGSNPRKNDTDGDGLSDGEEVLGYQSTVGVFFSNPTLRDTDSDEFDDLTEVLAGKDPSDPASYPGLRARVVSGTGTVYLEWDLPPLSSGPFAVEICEPQLDSSCIRLQTVEIVGPVVTCTSSVGTLCYRFTAKNDVFYRFRLLEAGVQRWKTLFAKAGEFVLGSPPPAPEHPILFLHGICLPVPGVPKTTGHSTWGETRKFLEGTLGWRYGGNLKYDKSDDPAVTDPVFDDGGTAGDFYTATFGDCEGDYPDGRGLAHQADEVAGFVRAIRSVGVSQPLALFAHSMGGLSGRKYLVQDPGASAQIAQYVSYGSPHWGASFASVGQLASDGARDLDFDCNWGRLDYTDNPFLESLRKQAMPSGISYTAIRGVLGFARLGGCLSSLWDSIIPYDSADFGAVPAAAPVGQTSLVPGRRLLTTDRSHWNEGNDVGAILCGLSTKCVIASVYSPVELTIMAPDGREISPAASAIPGASYMEVPDRVDHNVASVFIPYPMSGKYRFTLTPKPGAQPTDTYSLVVTQGDQLILDIQNQQIQDIPPTGFDVDPSRAANRPPAVALPARLVYEATSANGASVVLDAQTAASDPDGDVLTVTWSGPFGIVRAGQATVNLALGDSQLTLTADDGRGGVAVASMVVSVVDSTAPRVIAPTVSAIFTTEAGGARASGSLALRTYLAAATAKDLVDPAPTSLGALFNGTQVAASTLFPLGTSTVSFRFRDLFGNVGVSTSTLTITRSPDINHDGAVTTADLNIVKAAMGKKCGQAGFNVETDMNGDCLVNVSDLSAVSRYVGVVIPR